MTRNFGLKLIAVVDKFHLVFYEAEGLKINGKINSIDLSHGKNHKQQRHEGFFQKTSDPSGFFSPHTDPKELDDQNAARVIIEHLEDMMQSGKYKELLIASSPRMLGYVRQYASTHLKDKISKELDKDLVNENMASVEKRLFA